MTPGSPAEAWMGSATSLLSCGSAGMNIPSHHSKERRHHTELRCEDRGSQVAAGPGGRGGPDPKEKPWGHRESRIEPQALLSRSPGAGGLSLPWWAHCHESGLERCRRQGSSLSRGPFQT